MPAHRALIGLVLGGVAVLTSTLSSVPAAVGDRDRGVRRVVTPSTLGTVVADVRWVVDRTTASDALRGRIEYRPGGDPDMACSSIRFVQTAKVQKNGGADYDWQMWEADRNLQRTPADDDSGIRGGYFVDHEASACAFERPCSPYFRDSWANPDESQDGFQRGAKRASASLVDYPYGWDAIEQISLESCARCVDTGAFLGCAEWGATWPTQGPRAIAPVRIRERPSTTFFRALNRFEEFYAPIAPGFPLTRIPR